MMQLLGWLASGTMPADVYALTVALALAFMALHAFMARRVILDWRHQYEQTVAAYHIARADLRDLQARYDALERDAEELEEQLAATREDAEA